MDTKGQDLLELQEQLASATDELRLQVPEKIELPELEAISKSSPRTLGSPIQEVLVADNTLLERLNKSCCSLDLVGPDIRYFVTSIEKQS